MTAGAHDGGTERRGLADRQDSGRPSNAALEAFLRDLVPRGTKVLYVPNLGNAGDSLIAAATFQVFRRLGLRWRLLDHRDLHARVEGAVLIYGGGGNLVPLYGDARRFITAYHRRARRLVLLPHTVEGHEDLLGELGPNVELIAREQRSFDHIRAHAPRARAHLMHDVALGLDLDELRRGPLRLFALPPSARAAGRLALRGWQRLGRRPAPPSGRVLNAFRTDKEATGIELPAANFDLSKLYEGWVAPEAFARIATRDFLAVADRYDEIRTNRLHVGIAGALLGKRVVLHDNSYGKNRAVWAHSLAGRFADIEWCDTWSG
jgi:exopolysaccharide biosynthesis predicted pyruvyltransferase EpsI